MPEPFSIFASDFHLAPNRPEEIEVFTEFTRRVVAGADRFFVLGDLFEYWIGRHQLEDPVSRVIFESFRTLSAAGTEISLFHGNRDFLLGDAEARAAGGRVVGEELAIDLYGRRVLAMHGDSLCTRDLDYQRSKPLLRSGFVRFLSRTLPGAASHAIARRLRGKSTRSVAKKDSFTMGIVDAEVERRLSEGFSAIVCGHVHQPQSRRIGSGELVVLGDWHGGGIYARATRAGVDLARFPT